MINSHHKPRIRTTAPTKSIHYFTIKRLHGIDRESEPSPFQFRPFQNMNDAYVTFHACIQTLNTSSPIFPGNNCQKPLKLLLITIIGEKGSKPTAFVQPGKLTCEEPIKFHHLCWYNRLAKLPQIRSTTRMLTFSPCVTGKM